MRADLKSILRRGTNKDEVRRRAIAELIRTEYPEHFAAGVTDIEALQTRLDRVEVLEKYLDQLDEISLVSLLRRARKEYGAGKWLKESFVMARLKRMMGDNIRNQVLAPSARDWKRRLRDAVGGLPLIPNTSSGRGDLGTWSKERARWRIQIAIMARDVREATYHHPFIRHLRMRHDDLGKLPARYTQSRLSKWRRKQVEVKRRALYGFASPLSEEMEESEEEVMDESSEGDTALDGEMEEEDRREVSVTLDSPKGKFDGTDYERSVRVTVIEVDELEEDEIPLDPEAFKVEAQGAKVFTSVTWTWGECWV